MRIMHISSARSFGGGERHLVDLCRGLAERGHEVFVALRPTNEWQHRLGFLPPENILHVSIRNSFGVLSAMRIAEFARDKKVSILHAHVARDYIPASIACLGTTGPKFVLTRHVMFPLKPFNRFALKNVSAAIAVSDAVADNLKKVFPTTKIVVVPNGVMTDGRSPEQRTASKNEFREFHAIPKDAFVIGTLGELREMKGQRDLILAAAEVAKSIPQAYFVVAGKDNSLDRSFRRELKRLVKVFELETKFLWLDWIEDPSAFFSAIDVFVSPSHSESFGLAILEAMTHATPIVATQTDGAKALLGRTYGLVPIQDPVLMAQGIKAVHDDPELAAAMALELEKKAVDRFSLGRMLDDVEKLYRRLNGE